MCYSLDGEFGIPYGLLSEREAKYDGIPQPVTTIGGLIASVVFVSDLYAANVKKNPVVLDSNDNLVAEVVGGG